MYTSSSSDGSPHGRTSFRLFANHPRSFAHERTQPVGQCLVKQSWLADSGADAGLYIMMKLPPGTPGTDAGWVYGVATSDGRHITSAGALRSCMSCHSRAPRDRMIELTD